MVQIHKHIIIVNVILESLGWLDVRECDPDSVAVCLYNMEVNCYIAQYPILRTAQSASHFTPFTHQLGFSRKHPAMLQLMCGDEGYSYTNIHLCL